jgi:hypothetical protein
LICRKKDYFIVMFMITMNINYCHGVDHEYSKQNRISGKVLWSNSGTIAFNLWLVFILSDTFCGNLSRAKTLYEQGEFIKEYSIDQSNASTTSCSLNVDVKYCSRQIQLLLPFTVERNKISIRQIFCRRPRSKSEDLHWSSALVFIHKTCC